MTVITVKNAAKKFLIYHDKALTLKEKILFKERNHYEERWVLNDVSFDVQKGEALGIIGQNGSGKSTLLKMMTKIMYPDKGSIEMTGRISSLIELGAGFHPDMSGRENIYTNASIYGLTRREIENRVEQIIDFSELEEFIDNPIRTYSSGMYTRLAFSVSIHVDADILLVDEILAVGDAGFQAKCFNKMRDIKASGVTIVIVSHGLGSIEQLCERSIWIKDGYIQKQGSPFDVHPEYMDYMGRKTHHTEHHESANITAEDNLGNRDVEIASIAVLDENNKENDLFETCSSMNIKIKYKVNKPVLNPIAGVKIFRNDGLLCYSTDTFLDRFFIKEMTADGEINFYIKNNNLLAGEYSLDITINSEDGFAYDHKKGIFKFKIFSAVSDTGVSRLEHEWKII
ncbi:MAG: ABC transporter ATP-binding protein [Treponema sp.]|nr:ABC transporter ATP-binding protein [Treponema sp.]